MDLAVLIGIGAFIVLGIMFALLWLSGRGEGDDSITQEIIIKANTGTIDVVADATQEEGN